MQGDQDQLALHSDCEATQFSVQVIPICRPDAVLDCCGVVAWAHTSAWHMIGLQSSLLQGCYAPLPLYYDTQ